MKVPPSSAAHPALDSDGTSSHPGRGPSTRSALPRTTSRIGPRSSDARTAARGDTTASGSTSPPPSDDPFGLHLGESAERRRGPAFIARDDATVDRDRASFIEATRAGTSVTAAAYLQSFHRSLLHGIGEFLLTRELTSGHPDLQFIDGPRAFIAKLGHLLDVGDGRDIIVRLAECIAPDDLFKITDGARPITDDGRSVATWAEELVGEPIPDDGNVYNDGPRGPRLWQPSVAIAVGSSLEATLARVMPIVAAQYIAVAERKRREASARAATPDDVTPAELVPGHPLAWYVARAFAEHPATVEPAGGPLRADATAEVEYRRVEEVRWLGPPAPWNAVQSVKPAKASREAVAARFLGTPTAAHRIAQVGHYFLIPEDVAATIPEAMANRRTTRRRGGDDQPADAVLALGTSTFGDDAAATEASVIGPTKPAAGDLLALWMAVDRKLDGLSLATANLPGHDLVAAASARHRQARVGLDMVGDEEAALRVVIFREQLDLLALVASDVGALVTHMARRAAADPWADRISAGQRTRLLALLRAASLSHLPETGRAALSEAQALEQTQVLDVLDALFADAVARVESARHVQADSVTQGRRAVEVFGAALPERRDLIRQEMADLRTRMREGTAQPEELQRLVVKVDGFRFEAMLVANYGAIQQVVRVAEQLQDSDWVAAVGKFDNLEDIRGAGHRFRLGVAKIYSRWLGVNQQAKTHLAAIEARSGDPDLEVKAHALIETTLADLRAQLAAIGDDEGVRRFLRQAYDEIDDAQTKAAILQVATVLGVTIAAAVVSAGVGSAVGGAATGLVGEGLLAGGIGLVAESATMSLTMTVINGGGFGEAFAVDMAQNVAMLGALKGFDNLFRATRLGEVVGHGAEGGRLGYYTAKGVELTGRSMVMLGMMAAGAEVENLRTQGRALTQAEIEAQGVQGIAQVFGTAVLARLAHTPMAQLRALGARGGALARQHVELKRLAQEVADTRGDASRALDLMRAERAYLEAELALWTDLSTKSAADLHRQGVEPEMIDAMLGSARGHLAGLDALEAGTLPAQLGLETVVPGKVFASPDTQVDRVLERYEAAGHQIETHVQTDGSHRHRVTGADGVPMELVSRPTGLPVDVAEASARKAAGERWSNKTIRDHYNAQNKEISDLDHGWRAARMSPEQRAREAHRLRHQMRMVGREMMSSEPAQLDLLVRDAQKYGDGEGPTFEQLVEQQRALGKEGDAAFEAIIGTAQKTDRSTNERVNRGEDKGVDVAIPAGVQVHGDVIRVPVRGGEPLTVRVTGSADGDVHTVREPDGTFEISVDRSMPREIATRNVARELRVLAETPRQRTNDLDQLYDDATMAQLQLAEITRSVASELGGRPLIPDKLKGRKRAEEKIDADYNGENARITDLARSSIEFDTPQQVRDAVQRLGQEAEVVRIKDRFARPVDGYRDVMMNLRMPGGHIVEIQLHLKAILDVKNGPGHALYEQIRALDARAATENRGLTPEEVSRRRQLVGEMKLLYDQAYERSARSSTGADAGMLAEPESREVK